MYKNLWQNKCVESVKVKYGTCHIWSHQQNINFKEVHCHLFKQIYNKKKTHHNFQAFVIYVKVFEMKSNYVRLDNNIIENPFI